MMTEDEARETVKGRCRCRFTDDGNILLEECEHHGKQREELERLRAGFIRIEQFALDAGKPSFPNPADALEELCNDVKKATAERIAKAVHLIKEGKIQ